MIRLAGADGFEPPVAESESAALATWRSHYQIGRSWWNQTTVGGFGVRCSLIELNSLSRPGEELRPCLHTAGKPMGSRVITKVPVNKQVVICVGNESPSCPETAGYRHRTLTKSLTQDVRGEARAGFTAEHQRLTALSLFYHIYYH